MKYAISLVFVTFLSGLLGGCEGLHRSQAPSESQSIQTGLEMVDQGQYEEALQYFQGLYQASPSDNVLKAWASVYVARAGLKVSTLYEAFKTFPKENLGSNPESADDLIQQLRVYKKSLDLIPYIRGTAREDLQSASAILQSRNTPTVRVFRGFIDLVLLRSTFSDGDQILLSPDIKVSLNQNLKIVCKMEWRQVKSWLESWTLYGLELKQDLDFSFPSHQKDWAQGEKFFQDARGFSSQLTRTCDP